MLFRSGIHVKFCLLLSACLVLAGCQSLSLAGLGGNKPATMNDTEDLLQSEGVWMATNLDKDMDPMKRHMLARAQVDPNDIHGRKRYALRAKPPKAKEQRIVALSKDAVAVQGRLMPPKAKLKNTKVLRSHHSGSASVVDVRMGEHPNKTRLVLDLTGETGFDYKLDNDKNLLLIQLPKTKWDTATKKVLNNHPLIQAYIVKPMDNGGAILAMRLKKPARILMSKAYEPNSTRGHRIVFDVASS